VAVVLVSVAVVLFLAGVGLGAAAEAADGTAVGRADVDGSRWFADHRNGFWNAVTDRVTDLAWTPLLVTVAVLTAVLAWRAWRRWREPLLVLLTVGGEIAVFVAVAGVVDRARPPVHRLDDVAATASFPSGHTAGSVALYGALAVVAAGHVDTRWVRRLVVGLLVAVPVAVALSRLYRGMHYPTDVLGGALVGGAWLACVALTLRATPARLRTAVEGHNVGDETERDR
jgi:membrane-associated phospholipid phosphatase